MPAGTWFLIVFACVFAVLLGWKQSGRTYSKRVCVEKGHLWREGAACLYCERCGHVFP